MIAHMTTRRMSDVELRDALMRCDRGVRDPLQPDDRAAFHSQCEASISAWDRGDRRTAMYSESRVSALIQPHDERAGRARMVA